MRGTTTEWSFSASARIAPERGEHVTSAQVETLAEMLADRGAAIGYRNDRLSLRFTVQARTARAAGMEGIATFQNAIDKVGLHSAALVNFDCKTHDELELELMQPNLPELVGVAGAAEILGVTKQRVFQLSQTPRFPRPVAKLDSGQVWLRASIEAFDRTWERRPGRPRRVGARLARS